MDKNKINDFENGDVNISDNVIEIISTIATEEIEGISGLSGKITDEITEIFGKKNLKKGVKVKIENDKVIVDLNVVVDFGVKIPDVSWNVQQEVKSSIEEMTGLDVKEVNIHVQGIKEKKKQD
ncbi:MAG: Asp23/Gls24 family envelope stress response protein [Bacillota bacterium]